MSIKNRLSKELFESGRAQTKGEILFFRLFEAFVVSFVIILSWKWGYYMTRNTEVIFPLGVANYIDISFMFEQPFALVNATVITVVIIFSFLRRGTRWQYFIVMLLFHLQYISRFSQGKIQHASNIIGLSLLCLSLGFIFFSEPVKRRRFTLGLLIFFIGLGYTTAAFSKLIGTGINWADGSHLWLWIAEKKTDILSRTGTFHYNWFQELILFSRPSATIILTMGWLTELSGFLMWWKNLRPYIVTCIILMHIGITLSLNIQFDEFIYILILIGYPWAALIDRYILYIPGKEFVKKINR